MMKAHLLQQRVLQAARSWWASKRPKGMTEAQHLADATVNTSTVLEHQLARAVAALTKDGWNTGEARKLVEDLLACAKGLDRGNWRTCDEVINRYEIFRRAEVFLGKREVSEEYPPQARPRVSRRRIRLFDGDEDR
jgi:polyhydroxyalkanoate synthesis regulator phasin